MGETTIKIEWSASKVLAFIGMLFIVYESYNLLVLSSTNALLILYGILGFVFVFLILVMMTPFKFLEKLKIPYAWWMLLIIGALQVLFAYLVYGLIFLPVSFIFFPYLGGTLVLLAFFVELLGQKKTYKSSKIVLVIGAALAIFDAILYIYVYSILLVPSYIVRAIFAIIFAVIIIILLIGKIDIKIPLSWGTILVFGFFIYTYISAFSGVVILVSCVLMIKDY